MQTFSQYESKVRSYCRDYPVVFETSKDEYLYANNDVYLDFLSGCGSLNYGHNNDIIKKQLLDYIQADGITHSMDCHTTAKEQFIKCFVDRILHKRDMDYRLQFPGPTGSNAVEAAIKLARKITGRTSIVSFTNGFHGCTMGSLSLTGSHYHRAAAAPLLGGVQRHFYDGYFGDSVDTSEMLLTALSDPSSGFDAPAAIIVECVQGEGGLNTASEHWISNLSNIAKRFGALLIIDDIQAGCGRTGSFFSFENSNIEPDIIVLSKSLSGYGLPFSMVLIKPEHDKWNPGEHNGTFRGNNHAFVTAKVAIDTYWSDDSLQYEVLSKEKLAQNYITMVLADTDYVLKGRGLLLGIETFDAVLAGNVKSSCFNDHLIVETCGPNDSVIKLIPPLTISLEDLQRGLTLICNHLLRLSESSKIPGIENVFLHTMSTTAKNVETSHGH